MSDHALLITTLTTPFLAAVLSPLAYRLSEKKGICVPLAGAVIPTLSLITLLKRISGLQTPLIFSWSWVQATQLKLSFVVDGFGGLFALMVGGIGCLIVWYAHSYMKHDKGKGRFFGTLLFFLGSMLGIALGEHMFTTFLFWEGTSISSFLLIGFWHEREKSRAGALKALVITVTGGLCMMAGFALLGIKTGLWEWSPLAAVAPTIQKEAWFGAAFLLILLGAFTKSAQFPFHIWLPDAMEAPTPVSAYLHCATMVKAGVFLLFRLYPIFSGHPLWLPLLAAIGMTTFVVGSVLALKHTDLKAILAYTTVAQLGLFVVMHGYAPTLEIMRVGLIFHIFVHSFYKGALFMLAGIIDHETGTRNIRRLGYLKRLMPKTSLFLLLASCSLAGLPPFLGFISKESAIEASLHAAHALQGWTFLLPLALFLGAAVTIGVAGKISLGILFHSPDEPDHLKNKSVHEAPLNFLLPPAILAVLGLIMGLFPSLLSHLLYPVGLVGLPATETPHFALWHGMNPALMMSAAAIAVGALLYVYRKPVQAIHEKLKLSWNLNTVYNRSLDWILDAAKRLTEFFQNGSLTRYFSFVFGFAVLLLLSTALTRPAWAWPEADISSLFTLESLTAFGLCLSSLLVVLLKDRIARVVSLGSVGFLICAFFTFRGAPDLALTGFLIEIAMFIMILLIFKQMDVEETPPDPLRAKALRVVLAGLGGLFIGGLVFVCSAFPLSPSIAGYYLKYSEVFAGGLNAVNVIVVDFRGFDTLGEITVLCLASLGVFALRRVWVKRHQPEILPRRTLMKALPPSQIFHFVSALIFPLVTLFAVYMTVRGHNAPGGGFIGGLIMAGGFILELLAVGRNRFLKFFPVNPRALFVFGLGLAFVTGLAPLFLGYPFLTSYAVHAIHFSTASIFDLGIFFAVVGVTIEIIMVLEETERKEATA